MASLLAAPTLRGDVTRFTHDNGLRVILQPVPAADKVALVVLFDMGEDDDPPGKSGFGHLLEHVYVTAAAGDRPRRTADQLMQQYAAGWNAQTGADYTVIATVFAPHKLDYELAEAAARMGDLHITQADLDAELPRLLDEVEHMFSSNPRLAVANWARESVRPTAAGGRRGGLPAHLATIDVDALRERWQRHYKPVNARLVLAGPFESADATALVRKHFAGLPKGERLAPREKRAEPSITTDVKTFSIKPKIAAPDRYVGIAFPAPKPNDEHYPAFLVLVSRLWMNTMQNPAACRVTFTPLDDPVFLSLSGPVDSLRTANEAMTTLTNTLDQAAKIAPSPVDIDLAKKNFATLLSVGGLPDQAAAQNVYGAAFGLGRRDQLQLDPERLTNDLNSLSAEKFSKAMTDLLGTNRRASIVVETSRN